MVFVSNAKLLSVNPVPIVAKPLQSGWLNVCTFHAKQPLHIVIAAINAAMNIGYLFRWTQKRSVVEIPQQVSQSLFGVVS